MSKIGISNTLSAAYSIENLNANDEFILINKWRENHDKSALESLVFSHLKLVRKMANGYKGHGISIEDLVSEGYIGVMQALKSFDPVKGFRFSTYARYCIRTVLQDFVIKTASIVGIKPTNDNKKLFFGGLTRSGKKMNIPNIGAATNDEIEKIAKNLDVTKESVQSVMPRFSKADFSLDKEVGEEGGVNFEEWVEDKNVPCEAELLKEMDINRIKKVLYKAMEGLTNRELKIIKQHRLSDNKVTFIEIAEEFGVSSERIRQIEHKALSKLKKFLINELKYDTLWNS